MAFMGGMMRGNARPLAGGGGRNMMNPPQQMGGRMGGIGPSQPPQMTPQQPMMGQGPMMGQKPPAPPPMMGPPQPQNNTMPVQQGQIGPSPNFMQEVMQKYQYGPYGGMVPR